MLFKVFAFFLAVSAFYTDAATPDADPVEITLFYEALCPYCQRYILNQLYPAWLELKDTGIMKIKMYAFGNARSQYKRGRYRNYSNLVRTLI